MWNSLSVSISDVNLPLILPKGQSFRWRLVNEIWQGTFKGRFWQLCQDESRLHYRLVCGPKTSTKECEALLRDYLRLDSPSLAQLYSQWSKTIPDFPAKLQGVRILRQEPVETLFAFICSSNNNIGRIASMVEKMCTKFGEKIGNVEGDDIFAFPKIETLAEDGIESKLRELGFGYRAKFIERSAKQLVERGGEGWLYGLRTSSYEDAMSELLILQGIGQKVADCICLMALDKFEAVPVDTHVLNVALRLHPLELSSLFPPSKPPKSLSNSGYRSVGKVLREAWKPMPGWAQTVLFCSDLRSTKREIEKEAGHVSPPKIVKNC